MNAATRPRTPLTADALREIVDSEITDREMAIVLRRLASAGAVTAIQKDEGAPVEYVLTDALWRGEYD